MSPSRKISPEQWRDGRHSVSAATASSSASRTSNRQSKVQGNNKSKESGRIDQCFEPYSPLDQQTDEIRIVILHPGTGAQPLSCTLETYPLDSCKTFDALSYAWGDPTPVEPILVNGSQIRIAHNLNVALQHLRLSQSRRILWIDAICIDQKNIGERSHQVFMMNRIYQAAERVLVWLGEARDRDGMAMKRLQDFSEGRKMSVDKTILSKRLIYDCLIDRDWWGRLWVVQEVVLAKSDPIMICGSHSLPWKIFKAGYLAAGFGYTSGLMNYTSDVQRFSQCNSIFSLRQHYHHPIKSNCSCVPTKSLTFILSFTLDFHATDPRDKIYACLGLLSDDERERMKSDYQKSTELVFFEATEYLMKHSAFSPLSFFSISKIEGNLSRASPSWVPDFSSQKTVCPRNPTTLLLITRPEIPLSRITKKCITFQDHNRVLAMNGVLFDRVEVVVELKDFQELLLNQIPELEDLIRLAFHRVAPTSKPPYCVCKFKKYEDIFQVLAGGCEDQSARLMSQYKVLSSRADSPLDSTTSSKSGILPNSLMKYLLPGRFFFVTKMGFVGVAAAPIRKKDCVTFLFGEYLSIILRPRGSHFSVVSAAYVSGVMGDEVVGEMLEQGVVETRTFRIR